MRAVTAVAVLLLVFACQTPPPPELAEADRAAINALADAYQSAGVAGDWDGWSALWTENAVYMVPGAPALEGRSAIRVSLDAFPSPPSEMTVSIHAAEGFGQWAWARGSYSFTMPASGEMPAISDVGKFLWVLEKQADGRWLIDTEAYNSDLPLAPPPAGG